MRIALILPALLAGTTFLTFPAPQEPPRPGSDVSSKPVAPSTVNDGILSAWLLVDNDNEIELAQIAKDRAQSPEVRQFAEMVIADHRQIGDKLRPFAMSTGYVTATGFKVTKTEEPTTAHEPGETKREDKAKEEPVEAKKTDAERRAEAARDDAMARERVSGAIVAPADHVALLREMGQQCVDSSKRWLDTQRGADFDKAYIGMSAMGHQHALDKITVFKRHASSSLANVLSEGEKKVAMHLEHAKNICDRMKAGDLKAEPDERR